MTQPTDHLRRYGEDIASAVSPARSRVAAMRAVGQAQRTRPRSVPRIAFATLGVFVGLNVITAAAADAAVPGEALYPLDRAYERAADLIGLGGDRSEERIEEAQVLVSRSELSGALDLVAEAVDEHTVQEAVASLRAGDSSDPSLPTHVQALVSGVHQWVTARQAGEPQQEEEATARIRLVATQINEMARQGSPEPTGPPEHAQDQHPAHQGQGPPEEPGDQGQGLPGQPGHQAQDPPSQADDERSGDDGAAGDGPTGPPEESPAETNPGQGDPSPGPPADDPGDSGPQGPPGGGRGNGPPG